MLSIETQRLSIDCWLTDKNKMSGYDITRCCAKTGLFYKAEIYQASGFLQCKSIGDRVHLVRYRWPVILTMFLVVINSTYRCLQITWHHLFHLKYVETSSSGTKYEDRPWEDLHSRPSAVYYDAREHGTRADKQTKLITPPQKKRQEQTENPKKERKTTNLWT